MSGMPLLRRARGWAARLVRPFRGKHVAARDSGHGTRAADGHAGLALPGWAAPIARLFSRIDRVTSRAERIAAHGDLDAVLGQLRTLSLDEFGAVLLGMPHASYPRLSQLLPAMASDETQMIWTGNKGSALLRQSTTFIRSVWHAYERETRRSLSTANVLDYGCGYGRLLRLMLYFCPPRQIFGCDPWDRSIDLCREARIPAHLAVSDYLPAALPFPGVPFDLAYAYSVFTHTSDNATRTALAAMHRSLRPGGMLVATIRPKEYWRIDPNASPAEVDGLKAQHDELGFAFRPHARQMAPGEATYGDTSMTLDGLAARAHGWRIVGTDRTLEKSYQQIVYLVRESKA